MHYINKETREVKGFMFDGAVEMTASEWQEYKVKPGGSDNTAETEYNWAKSGIEAAIIQLSKCEFAEANPDNKKATCRGTSDAWTQYIIELRYYATYSESGGYSLREDERPVIEI